jgi:hypothetical protein
MSWRLRTRTAPRHRGSGARWWMGAALLAAGALAGAYLLDPIRGHDRRMRVVESTRHLGRGTGSRGGLTMPGDWPEEAPPDVDSES